MSPKIFILIISDGEKILRNVNVVVSRQEKRGSSSLPVAVRVSKTRVLKLPNNIVLRPASASAFLHIGLFPCCFIFQMPRNQTDSLMFFSTLESFRPGRSFLRF